MKKKEDHCHWEDGKRKLVQRKWTGRYGNT